MIYYVKLTFKQDPLSPNYIWSKNKLIAIEYYKCTLRRYSASSMLTIEFDSTDDSNIDGFKQENELVLMTSSNNSVVVMTSGIYNRWLDCDFEYQHIRNIAECNSFKLLTLLLKFCKDNTISDSVFILASKIRKYDYDIDTLDYLCKFDPFYKNYVIK